MEHQREYGDEDNATSRSRAAPRMPSIDAGDAGVSLDTMVFDNALSFLDNLDDLNDSVVSLLDDDRVFLQRASSLSVSQATPLRHDMNAIVSSYGGDGVQKQELPTKPSGSPENKKPSPTVATTRDRQKQELEYLRLQVVELEAELAQLKSFPDSSPSTLVESSAWEKIAKRQSEAKQKATIENAKLRELLEGQLKVARSLEKLLNKRAVCEPSDGFVERKRLRPTQPVDTNAMLEEIRGRIHLQFDDVDSVMDQCGLSVVYTDLDDAQATTRATTDDSICMELMVAKVLPFSVEQVAEAVWQCTIANHIELQNGYFGGSPRSKDLCDLQFAVQIKLRRAEALIRVHGVAARRAEPERSLLVFESAGATEGKLFAQDPIHCRERGYVLIEKNAMALGEGASPSTIVKICVCLWPESADTSGDKTGGSTHFGAFIDLVIGSYNQNTNTLLQLAENILLAQSLNPTKTD